eukprot:759439-Hanusia_phi.AAC.6
MSIAGTSDPESVSSRTPPLILTDGSWKEETQEGAGETSKRELLVMAYLDRICRRMVFNAPVKGTVCEIVACSIAGITVKKGFFPPGTKNRSSCDPADVFTSVQES